MTMFYLDTVSLMRDVTRVITEALTEQNLHLAPKEAHVLAALYINDKQRPSDLAAAVGEPTTSFTPVLDRLEGAGYVKRQPHPADRRSVIIGLTEAGAKTARRCHTTIQSTETKLREDIRAWASLHTQQSQQ